MRSRGSRFAVSPGKGRGGVSMVGGRITRRSGGGGGGG